MWLKISLCSIQATQIFLVIAESKEADYNNYPERITDEL